MLFLVYQVHGDSNDTKKRKKILSGVLLSSSFKASKESQRVSESLRESQRVSESPKESQRVSKSLKKSRV